MKYDKLVRDKIPEHIKKNGGLPVYHTADDAEFEEKLIAKLFEEAEEFRGEKTPTELADLLEVIHALADWKNFSWKEIEEIRNKKALEKGNFKKRIILEES